MFGKGWTVVAGWAVVAAEVAPALATELAAADGDDQAEQEDSFGLGKQEFGVGAAAEEGLGAVINHGADEEDQEAVCLESISMMIRTYYYGSPVDDLLQECSDREPLTVVDFAELAGKHLYPVPPSRFHVCTSGAAPELPTWNLEGGKESSPKPEEHQRQFRLYADRSDSRRKILILEDQE